MTGQEARDDERGVVAEAYGALHRHETRWSRGFAPVDLDAAYETIRDLLEHIRKLSDPDEHPERHEDAEAARLRALQAKPGERLCPDCHGEISYWFCERCSNTGLVSASEGSK